MKYLHTQDGISFVIDGRPYVVSSHQEGFEAIRDAVLAGRDPVHVLGLVQAKAQLVKNTVEAALRRQQLTGSLTYDEGVIYYDGKPLYNYAVDTLIKFLKLGHDVSALAAFIDKTMQAGAAVVPNELYQFLEHGKIPLTPDGDFLVYKAVRGDYRDIHSGTFDNRVGCKPRLPGRESVDPDRQQTCSYGLHVCSFGYLPHFANANGHVMICKVNPRDVVAIPADYNNTKMRVVGYEVVGEVTSYYGRGEDVLSQERLAEQRYVVQYENGGGLREVYDHFFTLDEAKKQAEDLVVSARDGAREETLATWVLDTKTNEEVYRCS